MIALLPVHLCCAMVPPRMARVFTKHKQVTISALCPTGMECQGLVSIGEALRCWWSPPDCAFFSDRARSKGHWQAVQVQCWVTLGLCAVPCNKRYHTLNNYKRSPRYLIGQIAGQMGTCILLWHSNIVIIYYFILFYCYFLFSWSFAMRIKRQKTCK